MTRDLKLLLFDVDGVLVEPRAYRLGISATLTFLCNRFGIENGEKLLPTEAEIAYMESLGIHDVWDITNIVFGLWLVDLCLHGGANLLLAPCTGANIGNTPCTGFDSHMFEQQVSALKMHQPLRISARADYCAFNATLMKRAGLAHPPDVARTTFAEMLSTVDPVAANGWLQLIDAFVKNSRSAFGSYGTRVFQNIILGGSAFSQTYGLESEYEGPSLLHTEDRPMLSKQSLKMLLDLNQRDDWKVAVYTARPSLPPPDVDTIKGYSPEAEAALALCQIESGSFPLVAMGMMEWLAENTNSRLEDLTKPNTTQACAALAACLKQSNSSPILVAAHDFELNSPNGGLLFDELQNWNKVTAFVFEDTVSGIKPMLKVCERLSMDLKRQIECVPFGISQNEDKRRALSEHCQDRLFDTANDALKFVLAAQSPVESNKGGGR